MTVVSAAWDPNRKRTLGDHLRGLGFAARRDAWRAVAWLANKTRPFWIPSDDELARAREDVARFEEREKTNAAYHERDQVVALVATLATKLDYRAGLGAHEGPDWDDEWRNVVYVDLPTGQVSWHIHESELPLFAHLPHYPRGWDGHTTAEKYARCEAVR